MGGQEYTPKKKLFAAREFEERVKREFEALGYKIVEVPEYIKVDFMISKFTYPFEIKILVEVKFFEKSLVSGTTVLLALESLQHIKADKVAIVTTLGFTEEAKKISEEAEGKVVLLTEMGLIKQIPRRRQQIFFKSFLGADYFKSVIAESLKKEEPRLQDFLSRIPKSRLADLLKFATTEELIDILIREIPRDILIKQLTRILKQSELEEIIQPTLTESPEVIQRKKKEIEETYRKAMKETDPNLKGKLLEDVVKKIIGLVPRLQVVGSNIDNGIEEIDIQVRNHNKEGVWDEFEGMIFVECKNWSSPVGSDEIRSFKGKLEHYGIRSGLLVATYGVTGDGLRGAWGEIKMLLQNGFKIIVLDGKDLKDILRCVDVSAKVDEKYIHLFQIGS